MANKAAPSHILRLRHEHNKCSKLGVGATKRRLDQCNLWHLVWRFLGGISGRKMLDPPSPAHVCGHACKDAAGQHVCKPQQGPGQRPGDRAILVAGDREPFFVQQAHSWPAGSRGGSGGGGGSASQNVPARGAGIIQASAMCFCSVVPPWCNGGVVHKRWLANTHL